jgi:hypothetical protein
MAWAVALMTITAAQRMTNAQAMSRKIEFMMFDKLIVSMLPG